MERRLAKLEVIWSRDGTHVASPEEEELTNRLVHAFAWPSGCAKATPEDQLRYLHLMIALSRLPPPTVAYALIAALVACDVPPDVARDAVRVEGVEATLQALAAEMAPLAARQDAEREREAEASRAAYAVKKAHGRAAYFASHPRASERDFEVGAWPKIHWRSDDPDELAALLAAAK